MCYHIAVCAALNFSMVMWFGIYHIRISEWAVVKLNPFGLRCFCIVWNIFVL
jgi:hypothetical protein